MDDELGKPFPDGEFTEAELRGMLGKYGRPNSKYGLPYLLLGATRAVQLLG
jgi:hypothetical protein